MHIKKLDHSALIVTDLERAGWFYGEVLGLQEVPRPQNFTFRGRWFRGPGFEFHLILKDDTTAATGFGADGAGARLGLAHHLALEVDDLPATITHLHEHGVEVFAGPMPRGDGVIQMYVFDPDQNFIELFAWDPDSLLPIEERPAIN